MDENSILKKVGKEVRKDHEKLKGKSFIQKAEYFIMYYKVPVIITVAVIAIFVSMLYSHFQSKKYAFHALFINARNTISDETFNHEFGEMLEIDTKRYAVSIDSSLYIGDNSQASVSSTEKFAAEVNSAVLDVCIMPETLFLEYAKLDCYSDLRDFLTEGQLNKYADRLVYEDDIPVGVKVADFSRIEEAELYTSDESPVFGIVYNTGHPESCSAFLDFLGDRVNGIGDGGF